jgi:S1-C subfamily serine protease
MNKERDMKSKPLGFEGNFMASVASRALVLCLLVAGASSVYGQEVPRVYGAPPINLRMTNDVRVYQLTKDAVVNISSTRVIAPMPTGNEIFDRFFNNQPHESQSLGSGFVIHPSGYIITNEHVIDQATEVDVVFSNGEKLEAQVIATDNEHDLAVLKVVPKKPLAAIALGTSEDLMIGEPVYAIGNPFGYAGTMTRGIVSAVDRKLEVSATKSYTGLIQTDASINPGNSGGPLLNAYGQVVGINTAIRADAHGIGFAIAVSNMRDLLPSFLNAEATNRAQIGFTVVEKRTMTPPSTVSAAVMVKEVHADSAAAKAGLEPNDQIVAINGVTVTNVVDALVDLAGVKSGEILELQVVRGGGGVQRVSVPVMRALPPPPNQVLLSKMGVEALTVTPAVVKKYRLPIGRGVLLTAIKPDSAASAAGLESGDVLYQLGPYYVNSVEDIETVLKSIPSDVDARVGIVRNNMRGRGIIHLH